jgi:uncharacterized protein (TIGR04141 family)
MGDKTNRLNICLIKPEYTRFDRIVQPDMASHEIEDVGTFYLEASHPAPPDWLKDFFGATLRGKLPLITSSASGVLLVRVRHKGANHIFALVFGFGRYLLQEDVIEERFGLKVVLNTVDPESLRSIDKTTLGSIPKQTREQMSRDSGAENFGIDVEQDLVKAVTGKSSVKELGKMISGRDALAVSVKVNAGDVKEFLKVCVDNYQSKKYKKNFEWIDQIKDVRSASTIAELDGLLIGKLKAGRLGKIWMAVPEIVDWVTITGFRYLQAKRADLHNDLDVRTFLQARGDAELTVDALRHERIYVISSKTGEAEDHWNAYKCLYSEIGHDGKICILNNGKWYEIIKDFSTQVQRDYDSFPESQIAFPTYNHASENAYNKALAAAIPGSCCMDQEIVFHGGGHNQIEFCDLLTRDKKLVHVKRYGSSSLLSHLFSQGVVSGELFVSDESFRRKLNEKLPREHKIPDVRQQPNSREYEIVFGIISKSGHALDIPFFSKVALRNARRRLAGYGYKVSKKKIPMAAVAPEVDEE